MVLLPADGFAEVFPGGRHLVLVEDEHRRVLGRLLARRNEENGWWTLDSIKVRCGDSCGDHTSRVNKCQSTFTFDHEEKTTRPPSLV